MKFTPSQVLDMAIESRLNDRLRLDSEASRILSVQCLERFATLAIAAAHTAGRDQGLREAGGAVQALHAKVADPIFGQERHDIGHAVIDNCAAAIEQLRACGSAATPG